MPQSLQSFYGHYDYHHSQARSGLQNFLVRVSHFVVLSKVDKMLAVLRQDSYVRGSGRTVIILRAPISCGLTWAR